MVNGRVQDGLSLLLGHAGVPPALMRPKVATQASRNGTLAWRAFSL